MIRSQLAEVDRERQAVGIQGDRGVYLEVASDPGFDLALKSLEHRRGKAENHVELVAVREQAERTLATVFVPEGKLRIFEGIRSADPVLHEFVTSVQARANESGDTSRLGGAGRGMAGEREDRS